MPTYDYICTACHHAWELEQRIVDDPVKKCPKCGASKAKRQISSGAGFILKGSGWYADGYGSKKPSSTGGASDDKAPSAEPKKSDADAKKAGPTTSSETKSDPKKPDPKKPDSSGSAGGGAQGGSSGGGRGGTESKASAA